MSSYDYAHRSGVEAITWDRFAELTRTLVEKLALFNVDAAPDVRDKVVAVVDEIADTGETLAVVAEALKLQASRLAHRPADSGDTA